MTEFAFDAFVTAAAFDRSGQAAFALGDGTVRFERGETVEAHPDAGVLAAAVHPSGEGMVTGGDDGRLVWSRANGGETLAEAPGGWIDSVAASPTSGLIAFAAGREATVLDVKDARVRRTFRHERTVAGLAFDPAGRRLAAASYGGAAVWFARIAEQKPTFLKWAGSHVAAAFSPGGKFLVTAMQENDLHAWRLADGKSLRLGGYPAKPTSIAFLSGGRLMATSGAAGAVLWPFGKSDGPMNKQGAEIGAVEDARVTRVAATPSGAVLAAGLSDGRVWMADVTSSRILWPREVGEGSPISALALSADGRRLAWGDEEGAAAVVDAPTLA